MATHLWIFCSSERRKLLMGWNRRSSWWIVSMLGKALHLLVFLFLCFLFIHLRASVCGCGDSHMKSSAYCSTNYMTKNCTNYLIEDILEQLLELCKALFFPPLCRLGAHPRWTTCFRPCEGQQKHYIVCGDTPFIYDNRAKSTCLSVTWLNTHTHTNTNRAPDN